MSAASATLLPAHAPARGILYVVATPIGNLQDLSARARAVLSQVQAIVAEDTRQAKHLTQCLLLSTPVLRVHLRNEHAAAEDVIARLKKGEHLALISDAGTPCISDPGGWVVRSALAEGIQVIPVPGACSAIAAWSASGFTQTGFLFYGFLPPKTQARRTVLTELATLSHPIIFYEAPHRIRDTLADLLLVLGNRSATLARELTKTYETIRRDTLEHLTAWAQHDTNVERGEIIVIVDEKLPELQETLDTATIECMKEMLAVTSLVSVVNWIQQLTKQPRDKIYQTALTLKNNLNDESD